MKCRFCKSDLKNLIIDLGMSPLANSYLQYEEIFQKESFYPLRVFVCDKCFLAQLAEDAEKPENIFSNYAYFSSYSKTWMKYAEDFSKFCIKQFKLDQNSHVVEIASNDGYLLQNFKEQRIPILGIEPASNVAKVAENKGIPTINKFFGKDTALELAKEGKRADLLIAINVMPHVPDLIDFVSGIKILLKPNGVLVIQFSTYLIPFLENTEFDSIYHEHFSYFSLTSIQKILASFDLEIFDVEQLLIHGGSLRIHVKHKENSLFPISSSVNEFLKKEIDFGITNISTYADFQKHVVDLKLKIWNFFIEAKKQNKKIVCYGASAKGNTLLNFCGIGTDLIDYTVDISPYKQGLYLPGTHIPIFKPDKIRETKPDFLVILAWNLKEEIMQQMDYIKEWNGKFVILIPEVKIL